MPKVPLKLAEISAFVFRAPIDTPVQTSFGIMHARPAVFVRVRDEQGQEGWGEVWCNFPSVGAEHRARLVHSVLAPLLKARDFDEPAQAYAWMTDKTEVLAIQSAEPGPIAQCIAGLDVAIWDLWARRQQQPLWRLLGGSDARIRVYASGLNPTAPEQLAQRRWDEGYRAFKLKVGFGQARDAANLEALRQVIGDAPLMVDANQAWSLDQALEMGPMLAGAGLGWLEEPLRADRPWSEWRQLRQAVPVPLAAGENIAGGRAFDEALASQVLSVVQPDLAKWGGFTATLPVARAIRAAGLRYCPHYLGGGIGLLASAHLLAAVGGDGMLEIDANDNPLRSLCCAPLDRVQAGLAQLGDAPGLGLAPDLSALEPFAIRL